MNNYYFYKILYTILLIILYITKSIHVYAQGNEIDKKKILIKNQYEMMENHFPNQTPILTGSAEVLWLLCNNGNIENDNIHIPNDTDFVITSKGQTPLKNIGDYENKGGEFRTSTTLSNNKGDRIDIIREKTEQSYIEVGGLRVRPPEVLISHYKSEIDDHPEKAEDHKNKIQALTGLMSEYKSHERRRPQKTGKRGLVLTDITNSNSQRLYGCSELARQMVDFESDYNPPPKKLCRKKLF